MLPAYQQGLLTEFVEHKKTAVSFYCEGMYEVLDFFKEKYNTKGSKLSLKRESLLDVNSTTSFDKLFCILKINNQKIVVFCYVSEMHFPTVRIYVTKSQPSAGGA